ncbi:SDR family NAD(P)-dependent oxidoreductase (plasmid) [Streptomyces sp. CA-142005]|uniref:SDR family NAD(P)-dependent oxidoreductase n=1 Tax=Streptomyces sp. CA-142005 TaxID=3240052 RepID=UPI003D8E293B
MIAETFIDLVRRHRPTDEVLTLGRGVECTFKADLRDIEAVDDLRDELATVDRIFICHGVLSSKPLVEQSASEAADSLAVNLLSVVRLIEIALRVNPSVRIVAIGSESGIKGSYDDSYALAKAALHAYVGWRMPEFQEQQLVCIAPSMISDTGMTIRRADQERVEERARSHPQGRLLTSAEVASFAYHLLYQHSSYLTNTVIPMTGSKFAHGPAPRPVPPSGQEPRT